MLKHELGMVKSLWSRDMLRLWKEHTRWIGVVIHPLLMWVFIGYGIDRSFGSEGSSYLAYFYPGVIVMSILFTTIYATMSIIEDRSEGFLQAVLVAPGSRPAMLWGKIAGVTSVGLIQAAIFLALSPWAGFQITTISWLSVAATVIVSLVGFTAMNFAFAWKINSTQGYHAIMNVVLIPLWMLSGAIFPKGPPWLETLMRFNPLTYVVTGLRKGMEGATLFSQDMLVPLITLTAFAILTFQIASFCCRRGGGE